MRAIQGDTLDDGPADWPIAAVAAELGHARTDWRAVHPRHAEVGAVGFPSRRVMRLVVDDLSAALFPARLGHDGAPARDEDGYVRATLASALERLAQQVRLELVYQRADPARAHAIVDTFARRLPAIRRLLDSDVEAAFAGDPAARSVDEILLCYPFVTAILCHRLAHELYALGITLVARMIAEIAHSETAIDIHPGATIGRGFFIDHGSGVVIGETAVIGERVRLYQAVTLGARSFPADAEGALIKGIARHPIIEDDVVIYAGATILGRVTIGAGSVIGGNVWLTEGVAPGSVIHQACAERATVAATLPAGHVVAEEARG